MIQEIPDDFLLADFGSSVTAGAVVGLGWMDRDSQVIRNDQVISVEYALTVRTDLFGALTYGAQVAHKGSTYKLLHEPLKQADGRFCVMVLEKLEAVAAAIQATLLADGLALVTSDGLMVVF
jgi:hypothetical protein